MLRHRLASTPVVNGVTPRLAPARRRQLQNGSETKATTFTASTQGAAAAAPQMQDVPSSNEPNRDDMYHLFEQLLEQQQAQHAVGSFATGQVVSTDSKGAYVDLSCKSIAICPIEEASMAKLSNVTEILPPGMVREFKIIRQLPDGSLIVSLKAIEDGLAWQRIAALHENDATIPAKLVGYNNGGFIVTVDCIQMPGFLPYSHTQNMFDIRDSLVGTDIPVKILNFDQTARKVVVSSRRAESKVSVQRFTVGDVVEGVVTKTTYFGAFLDLGGGCSGLLHVSQISHDIITSVERVLSPGDKLKVMVLSFDREKGRVALSTKKLEPTPGDMLRDPALVFDRADEMAAQFRQRVAAASAAAAASDGSAPFSPDSAKPRSRKPKAQPKA